LKLGKEGLSARNSFVREKIPAKALFGKPRGSRHSRHQSGELVQTSPNWERKDKYEEKGILEVERSLSHGEEKRKMSVRKRALGIRFSVHSKATDRDYTKASGATSGFTGEPEGHA